MTLPKASLTSPKAKALKDPRDYRKKAIKDAEEFGAFSFGDTGMTGRS